MSRSRLICDVRGRERERAEHRSARRHLPRDGSLEAEGRTAMSRPRSTVMQTKPTWKVHAVVMQYSEQGSALLGVCCPVCVCVL